MRDHTLLGRICMRRASYKNSPRGWSDLFAVNVIRAVGVHSIATTARIACVAFPTPMFDEDDHVIGRINMLVDISRQQACSDFQDAFSVCIAALPKAHSLLTDNAQQYVPLRALPSNEFAIYEDGDGEPIRFRSSLSGIDRDGAARQD